MRFLQSKSLALWLIITLVVASLIGVIIPQEVQGKSEYAEWAEKYQFLVPIVKLLGLNQVFKTKWFLLLGLVFFINLASCTLGQINKVWKLWRIYHQNVHVVPRGFWRVFGNCIFHIGLAIIIVGGLISFGYKMSGYAEVAEGETFVENHQNYGYITEGQLFKENHLGFQLTVNEIKRIFTADGQLDYATSKFTITDNGRSPFEASAELGQPFTYRRTTFYYTKSGYAPFVTIKDAQGRPIIEGYALFSSGWDNNARKNTIDLALPGSETVLKMQFFPDAFVNAGLMTSKSMKINNPVIQTTIMDKGKLLGKIEIRPEQDATFKGWTVGMKDVRLWTGFEIVRDPGAPVIFTGFIISLSGIMMGFLFTTKKNGKEQEDEC